MAPPDVKVRFRWLDKRQAVILATNGTEKFYAKPIHEMARQLCPVLSGRLRASIQIYESGEKFYVGTPINYAPFVEYGTRHMRAQPFLGPALASVSRRR